VFKKITIAIIITAVLCVVGLRTADEGEEKERKQRPRLVIPPPRPGFKPIFLPGGEEIPQPTEPTVTREESQPKLHDLVKRFARFSTNGPLVINFTNGGYYTRFEEKLNELYAQVDTTTKAEIRNLTNYLNTLCASAVNGTAEIIQKTYNTIKADITAQKYDESLKRDLITIFSKLNEQLKQEDQPSPTSSFFLEEEVSGSESSYPRTGARFHKFEGYQE